MPEPSDPPAAARVDRSAPATSPGTACALLALWNDVDPALDALYNDWHAHEHVPERLSVPGMRWARRYRQTGGPDGPAYLTLYGLRDAAVLDSAPYQRLLSEPTPMSRRMRPALRHITRWVCTLDGPGAPPREGAGLLLRTGGQDAPGRDDAQQARAARAALALALSRSAPPAARPTWLAHRLADAAPLPWLPADPRPAGERRAIEGQWLLCAEGEPPWRAGTTGGLEPAVRGYAPLPIG